MREPAFHEKRQKNNEFLSIYVRKGNIRKNQDSISREYVYMENLSLGNKKGKKGCTIYTLHNVKLFCKLHKRLLL
jgi:hypothetical protein